MDGSEVGRELSAIDEIGRRVMPQIQAVRGTSSGDRVAVAVDVNGKLLDIAFDQSVSRLNPRELSRQVLTAYAEACEHAAAAAAPLLAELQAELSRIGQPQHDQEPPSAPWQTESDRWEEEPHRFDPLRNTWR
ncbi:YbaB/EbfC family nucleoid-associated protein [Gordonia sp. 852002-50395_SCH5434458]|uniref:YbaB/EbfC family nucleoid-associated protein n=1 Tax=Gordonia sp. 852002-50395_SCH5434458 TaxID=1834090 RepID=UPI0007EA6F2F|nr:YbaB/EbfC family nucleoid-associated protein [Gordonia sp. 852002-50395_SCH5434458]OBC02708.1 hypothetical protein A5785_02530 [Gordonia sp. 852002-50395_SCH5434458]